MCYDVPCILWGLEYIHYNKNIDNNGAWLLTILEFALVHEIELCDTIYCVPNNGIFNMIDHSWDVRHHCIDKPGMWIWYYLTHLIP